MSIIPRGPATAFYRLAANFSARMLAASPVVRSVVLHRSVATGEVDFGQSDIDMMLIIDEERAAQGLQLAALYRTVHRAQRMNPALQHIDVFDPRALASFAHIDTFTGSIERRTMRVLRGAPVAMPELPVNRDHALSKFLLWTEWFFPVSVQKRDRRNIRKTALEAWNAYACAEGLTRAPCLTRAEMETEAIGIERGLSLEQLQEPSYAIRFMFELADRLHRARMPALRKLDRAMIFDALTSPLQLRRRFVVAPNADAALPEEIFAAGAFPCTPELLDLFIHFKNAFFDWMVPPELRALGISPPTLSEWKPTIGYYSHDRFLFHPGFANAGPPTQSVRMTLVRDALDYIRRGEFPRALDDEEILALMASGARTIEDYYRVEYESMRRETRRIQDALMNLADDAPLDAQVTK